MHADLAKAGNRFIFFWNLDEAVGLNGANETMDVLFVSWCFLILAQQSILPTAMKKTFNDVGLTGICSGREGDPLITAIKLYQTEVKRVVDGRVGVREGATTRGDVVHVQVERAAEAPDQGHRARLRRRAGQAHLLDQVTLDRAIQDVQHCTQYLGV